MRLRLIRNATLQLEFAGQHLLVDPMLAEPYRYPSLTWGASAQRNPTVPLPCSTVDLLSPDAVLVTHMHFDHFDRVAAQQLPKRCPVFGQPSDQRRLSAQGFEDFWPVENVPLDWRGVQISRVAGRHGQGIVGLAMGAVSGFVLRASGEPTLYVAGDTIWYSGIQKTIETYRPEVIVVNSGAAQFNVGAPIIMTAADVMGVCQAAPDARVIAVHLEAINHCRMTRRALAEAVTGAGVSAHVDIPEDGAGVI